MTLSIISLVVAAVALSLAVRRELLERPSVHVSADPTTTPDGRGQIVFTVENRGRQPVTVGAIGLAWNVEGQVPGGEQSGELLANDSWDRVRIEPGGHHQIRWEPPSPTIPLDTPMRAFVAHADRRAYGRVDALFRLLHILGWSPDPAIPPPLARPLTPAPRALPVVAAWKLWHDRSLREPTEARVPRISREQVDLARSGLSARSQAPPSG